MPSQTPLRSRRSIIYKQIRADLKELGYDPLRPIYLDKFRMYTIIIIAVNYIASILKRDPYRVYETIVCRARRTKFGKHRCDYKQDNPTPERVAEWDRETGGLHVWCPRCHLDLLDAGKLTQDEVLHDIKQKQITQKSPHLRKNEGV